MDGGDRVHKRKITGNRNKQTNKQKAPNPKSCHPPPQKKHRKSDGEQHWFFSKKI